MLMFRNTVIIVALMGLSITACKKDESSPSADTSQDSNANSVVCTVDGDSFEADGEHVVGGYGLTGEIKTLFATGYEVNETDSTSVNITVTTTGDDGFFVGQTFSGDGSLLSDWCFGVVTYDNGIESNTASSEDNAGLAAECTITALDTVNHLWSCTFSFDAVDDASGESYNVENGVFTDVEY